MSYNQRKQWEKIEHLKIDLKREREWNQIPESLKPTSKSRWNQMGQEEKNQESRRLGWPNSRGV